jgi:hypothetical protein
MDKRYASFLGRVLAIVVHHPSQSDNDGVRPFKCDRMEYRAPRGISSRAKFIMHRSGPGFLNTVITDGPRPGLMKIRCNTEQL